MYSALRQDPIKISYVEGESEEEPARDTTDRIPSHDYYRDISSKPKLRLLGIDQAHVGGRAISYSTSLQWITRALLSPSTPSISYSTPSILSGSTPTTADSKLATHSHLRSIDPSSSPEIDANTFLALQPTSAPTPADPTQEQSSMSNGGYTYKDVVTLVCAASFAIAVFACVVYAWAMYKHRHRFRRVQGAPLYHLPSPAHPDFRGILTTTPNPAAITLV